MRISDWSSDVCSSDLVKLMGRILARRIRPTMLHANTMLDEFMTSLQTPVARQVSRNVHMQRARFGSTSQMKMCANDQRMRDDPCTNAKIITLSQGPMVRH